MFNIFRKKSEENRITTGDTIENSSNKNNKEVDYNQCIEIAKKISNNNSSVVDEVTECVKNPIQYFNSHSDIYNERGIEDANNVDEIIWISGYFNK
ncbi:MAG: hypothetical protein J6J36_09055 [Clostridia bacterium]|nr:hypothetical protein [Clostridia bacterium]